MHRLRWRFLHFFKFYSSFIEFCKNGKKLLWRMASLVCFVNFAKHHKEEKTHFKTLFFVKMIKSSANRDSQSIKSLSFAFAWRWEKKLQNWIDFSHFFTFFSIVWIRNGISQHNNAWKVDGISQHNNAWKFDCSLVWIFECIKYDNAKEDLFYWSKKKQKKTKRKIHFDTTLFNCMHILYIVGLTA